MTKRNYDEVNLFPLGSQIFWTLLDHLGPTKDTKKSSSLSLKPSFTISELFCTSKMPALCHKVSIK